jgi:type II secretion system protein I
VKRQSAKQGGFTLLEVLVATTIMAIAVVGVLSALSSTVRNAARLTDYDRAVMLGRSKIDELLLDVHFPRGTLVQGSFDPFVMGGMEGGWSAQLSHFEMPPSPAPGDQALDRMQLQIWWMSGSQRRTFALEGYRASVLRPEDLQQ